MRLTMKDKKKATEILSRKYQKVRKKEKGGILDNFVELSGYTRSYASYVLNKWGRKIRIGNTIFILGYRKKKAVFKRQKRYGKEVFKPLKGIWMISGAFYLETTVGLQGRNKRYAMRETAEEIHRGQPENTYRF